MEISTIQPFLQYFGNVRERTMRVARCVPPDKMDWSYAPGKFTLGDLLRHIAVTERYMFAENVQGRASRYTSHGKEFADGRDNVLSLYGAPTCRSDGDFREAEWRGFTGQVPQCRRNGHHGVEMAALHDGTRNPSS